MKASVLVAALLLVPAVAPADRSAEPPRPAGADDPEAEPPRPATLAEPPATPPPETVQEDEVAGGQHWRIPTASGPIHVWRPAAYAPRTAGIVIYVHGYWIDADGAFAQHRLAEQFAASAQNALFIVPEAPAGAGEEPRWPHLADLLDAALAPTGLARPPGPVVVAGHSGAFEQISRWLDDGVPIAHILLIDALYGYGDQFLAWLSRPTVKPHRLTVIAQHTLRRARRMRRLMREATRVAALPATLAALGKKRNARFLFVVSQVDHYALIQEGKVLPLFLGRTPLVRTGAAVAARREVR